MQTNLNFYSNLLFVRPSVHLVINRLRLDSSPPPQFLNDQTDRWTDKRQIELAIQIGEHSYMPT